MNKEEVQEFATKCYKFFNGWINPTVKSQELKFGLPSTNHNVEHVLATTLVSTIYLESNRLLIEFDFRGYKEENQKRYLIAHIIAHELSHVGQKMDFLLLASDYAKKTYGYSKFIENSNDYNTYKFMKDNWDMITEELGDLGGKEKLKEIEEKMQAIASFYSGGDSDKSTDMNKLYEMEEDAGEKAAAALVDWTHQDIWSLVFGNGTKEGYIITHAFNGENYSKKFLDKCKIYQPEEMLRYIANVDDLMYPVSTCFSIDKNEKGENILNIHLYPLKKEI